jgi:hypothetical protein
LGSVIRSIFGPIKVKLKETHCYNFSTIKSHLKARLKTSIKKAASAYYKRDGFKITVKVVEPLIEKM